VLPRTLLFLLKNFADKFQHQQPTTALPLLFIPKESTPSMSSPITGTGISVVTDKLGSLRVLYQSLDGHVEETKHLDLIWTSENLSFNPVHGTPLASITYNSGKEASKPLTMFPVHSLTGVSVDSCVLP
jgi:hypothetical protein